MTTKRPAEVRTALDVLASEHFLAIEGVDFGITVYSGDEGAPRVFVATGPLAEFIQHAIERFDAPECDVQREKGFIPIAKPGRDVELEELRKMAGLSS